MVGGFLLGGHSLYTTSMQSCEACGGDSVNHPVEYAAALLDGLLLRLTSTLPVAMPWGPTARFSARAYETLARWGLGQLLDAPDDRTLLLDRMLWHEAATRSIRMREFRPLGSVRNTFTAQLPDGTVLDFEGVPRLAKAAWWVNDKAELKRRFKRLGFPTAMGGSARTNAQALALFKTLTKPVVVKPAMGSASRHTTMHVTTEEELERAFRLAHKLSPHVMVEEELSGSVYRPTLVDGKLIATLRRDQPHVVGDGISTIEELVAAANADTARQGPYFGPLRLDNKADEELRYQGYTPRSVPPRGVRVRLNQKINWSLGGTTADVTDDVHPDNRALFEQVARALGAPLLGIDFIAEDISRPWYDQRAGIIECNDMPYFDNHHLPFTGKPRDIAGPLWDLIVRRVSSS